MLGIMFPPTRLYWGAILGEGGLLLTLRVLLSRGLLAGGLLAGGMLAGGLDERWRDHVVLSGRVLGVGRLDLQNIVLF